MLALLTQEHKRMKIKRRNCESKIKIKTAVIMTVKGRIKK